MSNLQANLKVYLNSSLADYIHVPVSTTTTSQDVVAYCQPREVDCYLAELWRSCERHIASDERLLPTLRLWGIHRDEVRFFIRPAEKNPPPPPLPQSTDPGRVVPITRTNGMREHIPENMVAAGAQLTMAQLQELAARQQRQIAAQQQLLVTKEQRLRHVRQQQRRSAGAGAGEDGAASVRRAQERIDAHERTLRRLRLLRGQTDGPQLNGDSLASELDSIKALFNEKEKELATAVSKVEELTNQLAQLRNGHLNSGLNGDVSHPSIVGELEKLRNELSVRNKLNEQQSSKLHNRQQSLLERKDEIAKMDARIAELQSRLKKKRAGGVAAPLPTPPVAYNGTSCAGGQTTRIDPTTNKRIWCAASPNVAAVEPFKRNVCAAADDDDDDMFAPSKADPKYQTLPTKLKLAGRAGDRTGYRAYDEKPRADVLFIYKGGESRAEGSTGASVGAGPGLVSDGGPAARPDSAVVVSSPPLSVPVPSPSSVSPSSVSPASAPGSRPPFNMSNFAPRPFSAAHARGPLARSVAVTTVTQSSPAVFLATSAPSSHLAKTSTPRPSAERPHGAVQREIFITAAPAGGMVPSSGGASAAPKAVSAQSARSTGPVYQLATSRPQATSTPLHAGKMSPAAASTPALPTRPPPLPPQVPASPPIASTAVSSTLSSVTKTVSIAASTMSRQVTTVSSAPVSKTMPVVSAAPVPKASTAPVSKTSTLQALNVSNSLTSKVTTAPVLKVSTAPVLKVTISPASKVSTAPVSKATTGASTTAVTNTTTATSPVMTPAVTPGQVSVTSSIKVTLSDRCSSKPVDGADLSVKSADGTDSRVKPASSDNSGVKPVDGTGSRVMPADVATSSVKPMSEPGLTSPPKSKLRALVESTRPPSADVGQKDAQRSGMSVSSALSVLMSSATASGGGAKSGYRFAPKRVAPAAYTRNLSTGAVEHYRRNMSQLYRGFLAPAAAAAAAAAADDDATDGAAPSRPLGSGPPPYAVATALKGVAGEARAKTSLPQHITLPETVDLNSSVDMDDGEPLEGSPPRVIHINHMRELSGDSAADAAAAADAAIPFADSDAAGRVSPPAVQRAATTPSSSRLKKGNLKTKLSQRKTARVSFDPLALLLDASLEGELQLVMSTATQVPDPSASNDEGITALHNAICAGHFDIVRYLVNYGCNVNSPDSDGWTPLHCAASCNNLPMVRFLVEHGACIFATTISDHETAAEKCEEEEDGFDGCSEYLYSIQEKLGILNKGVVYAVFDYTAHNDDELSFVIGDTMTVLRKGDDHEDEWWWAMKKKKKEGYIPRNLLGLFPRIIPEWLKKMEAS